MHTSPLVSTSSARRLWGGVLALVLAAALAGCGGCGSEPTDDSDDPEVERSEHENADAAGDSMQARREVFGLPLPPSVLSIKDRDQNVVVRTEMSLDQLQAFFDARLTDYELIRPGRQLRAVGLRDYMPQLYAYASSKRRSTVVYLPAKHTPEQDDGDGGPAADRASAKRSPTGSTSNAKPLAERKKGEPVTDRTDDGKLLAPGARWGEPYTPPKGSPLHQKRFESNFGRPYGEWTLH